MNPAVHGNEDNAPVPVLYMALELSNKSCMPALSDGTKCRQVSVPAGDLFKPGEAVAKAKERFGMPATARVPSCYEAGRDGFRLRRHLRSVGIENRVLDAASIEVSRRVQRQTQGPAQHPHQRSVAELLRLDECGTGTGRDRPLPLTETGMNKMRPSTPAKCCRRNFWCRSGFRPMRSSGARINKEVEPRAA